MQSPPQQDEQIDRTSQNIVGDLLKRVILPSIERIRGRLQGGTHVLRSLLLASLKMKTRAHIIKCSFAVAQTRE